LRAHHSAFYGFPCFDRESVTCRFARISIIRGSIVASILACHARDPGSIPGLGVFYCLRDEQSTTDPTAALVALSQESIPGRSKVTVPGVEPGSFGSQPKILTTRLYHQLFERYVCLLQNPCFCVCVCVSVSSQAK
jgi:hypothetical protein